MFSEGRIKDPIGPPPAGLDPRGTDRVATRFFLLFLTAVLLVVPAPVGASTVLPGASLHPIVPTALAEPLAANATAIAASGSWNCGQGHETVNLFARAQGGEAPYAYLWQFGDGSPSSTAQNPVHTYQDLSGFTANLTVTDTAHASVRTSVNLSWAIPLYCQANPAWDWWGIALYLLLVVVVVAVLVVVVRGRRRRPLP